MSTAVAKFLIIDTEPTRQRNLRSILSSLGYKSGEVESIDNAEAALAILKKKKYECVFLSMTLSGIEGLDLLKQIRDNSRLREVPVVVFSSEVSKENVVSSVQAGASSFMGHPFSVSDVESVLKLALRKTPAK